MIKNLLNRSAKGWIKNLLILKTDILLGSCSAITTSALSILNLFVGFVVTSSTALITSINILITNEYISKLNLGFTKVRDCMNVITLLYEKRWNRLMVDKKMEEKKGLELEIYMKSLSRFKKRINEEHTI